MLTFFSKSDEGVFPIQDDGDAGAMDGGNRAAMVRKWDVILSGGKKGGGGQ